MPGLHIDKVGGGSNLDIAIEGDYFSIVNLRDQEKLVPKQKYLVTDYLHTYFIQGSNSTGIVKFAEIYQYIYGYATLGYYNYDLTVGRMVVINYLPNGYSGNLQVGDTTTVSVNSQSWYFQFANGMHTIPGIGFKYYLQRYTAVEENAVINDGNGRPILKPNGLLNIEVHDGQDYMDMPGNLNKAVIPEQILLTAKNEAEFEEISESITYPGDKLVYDLDMVEIYNDNYDLIGTRNGFIRRRFNEGLSIDLPIDWRNTKYRRWCLDEESRRKFINQHHDIVTSKLGYQEKWLFTAANRRVDQPQFFYIVQDLEGNFMNLNKDAMRTTFAYQVQDITAAKDFPVIPLNSQGEPIGSFNIQSLYNTVFQGYNGEITGSATVDTAYISSSTFVANPTIRGDNGSFSQIHAIDNLQVFGHEMELIGANILSKVIIERSINSRFKNCVFGSMQSGVRLTGRQSPIPVVWWIYLRAVHTRFYSSVFSGITPFYHFDNTTVTESSFFFYYSPTHPDTPNDSEYQREVIRFQGGVLSKMGMRFTDNVDRTFFPNLIFSDSNPNRTNGYYLYDVHLPVTNKIILKNETTDALYHQVLDADYNPTFIELAPQDQEPVDPIEEPLV